MKLATKGGPHQCWFREGVGEAICLLCVLLVNICRAHAFLIEPMNLVVWYKEIS